MLVYGKGSVVKHGIYEHVVNQLKFADIEIVEFSGIKANPVHEDVDKASQIGIENKVEMIIAVGGGSVIDSAKIMSLTIANNVAAWDIMKGKVKPYKALPLVAVLTLAATGTEMNGAAVIQNHQTKEKLGYVSPYIPI